MEQQGRTEDSAADGTEDGDAQSRSLSTRIARSLKDVDRLVSRSPEVSPQQRAMLQLEQAKVSALLELAAAIRESGRASSPKT
jgi:hypothetical protein